LGRHLGIRTSVALAVPLHREREQYGSRLAPKQFGESAASSISGSADTVAARAAADFADSATGVLPTSGACNRPKIRSAD
jgi:hypothetical protein